MAGPVEERVLERIAEGDLKGAATEAIRALGPQVLTVLRSVLRDEGDARDAFSQWAENLWKSIGGFRGESAVKTWALRLARNAALNMKDEAWRRRGRRLATGEASAIAEDMRTRSVIRDERQRQALDKLREQLIPDEQLLLVLRIDQGLSWNEVAEVIGEDANTATKRFERLKERLAKLARDQGLVG